MGCVFQRSTVNGQVKLCAYTSKNSIACCSVCVLVWIYKKIFNSLLKWNVYVYVLETLSRFDQLFDQQTKQDEVFEAVAKPVIDKWDTSISFK